MSSELSVVPADGELSRATVVALLSRVLGDDPGLTAVANGEFAELVWPGRRVRADWRVEQGDSGITLVMVEIYDVVPLQPAELFQTEASRVIEVLVELASVTGARLLHEDIDLTGASVARIRRRVTAETLRSMPEGVTLAASDSAQEYFERYLAAGEQRLELLEQLGAPTLDFSRESLLGLWGWAYRRLRLRPEDEPREKVYYETGDFYERPTAAELPMWFGRSVSHAPYGWSDESLALIDSIGFYVCECVRQAAPGTSWLIAHRDYPGYGLEGLPVVGGVGADLEPVQTMLGIVRPLYYALAGKQPPPAYRLSAPAPEDLQNWFDQAVAERRPQA